MEIEVSSSVGSGPRASREERQMNSVYTRTDGEAQGAGVVLNHVSVSGETDNDHFPSYVPGSQLPEA